MNVHHPQNRKRILAASLAAGFIALLLAAPLSRAVRAAADSGSVFPQHKGAKHKNAVPTGKEAAMPFRAGETLNYRVSWAAFSNAASLQLTTPERRDLFGWQVWHFRGTVHTLNPVRKLFAIDDQFDSYTDATTLESRQLELHINEMGKADDEIFRLTTSDKPYPVPGPTTVVLPDTRDPLGAIYALRAMDWKTTPEIRAPLYDGQNLYEAVVTRENAEESVTVASGTFSAARVSVRLFQYHKEVTAIQVEMWLQNSGAHAPVLIEAQLPFGTLRAELAGASNSN
jgi:Protein of unknown function (DUF3108)